jgi:hypothetical protein
MRRHTANLNAQSIRLFHEPDRLQYVFVFFLGLRFTRCVGYAESVQHHSPGQAHVSETNVSAALGYGVTQWFGRASDSPIEGRSAEAEMGPAMRRSHRDSRWQRALGFGLGKRRSNGYSLTRPLGPARSWGGEKARFTRFRSAPGYVVKRRWRRVSMV